MIDFRDTRSLLFEGKFLLRNDLLNAYFSTSNFYYKNNNSKIKEKEKKNL